MTQPRWFHTMSKKRKAFEYGSLNEAEAKERLALVKDRSITDELYDFGKVLLNEAVSRVSRLDTKASYVAAYAIGVITLLVSTSSGWATRITSWLPIASGVIAFLSAIFAVLGLTLRSFDWFSDNDWLRSECLDDLYKLRKYRVLSMLLYLENGDELRSARET